MDADHARDPIARTDVKRASERELVVTRHFDAPARLVFAAWTEAELMRRWWVPESCGLSLLSCDIDARAGGGYRLVFDMPGAAPMAFFGRYVDVTPPARLAWTNDEGGADGAVTTVTLEETGGTTRLVLRDVHASKEALDQAIESGSTSGFDEQFAQLDALLADLRAA